MSNKTTANVEETCQTYNLSTPFALPLSRTPWLPHALARFSTGKVMPYQVHYDVHLKKPPLKGYDKNSLETKRTDYSRINNKSEKRIFSYCHMTAEIKLRDEY